MNFYIPEKLFSDFFKYTTPKVQLQKAASAAGLALLVSVSTARAESADFAVKTNIVYDAAAVANIGFETRIAPQWSLDLSGNFISWTPGGKVYKHWMLQPEARYWFCDAMGGHFVGMHLLGGQFNLAGSAVPFRLLDHNKRYQGWGIGAGVAYGYSWMLSKHFNLEAELGLGYVWTRSDQFECENCGRKVKENQDHNYVGPTKAAINLVYLF